MQCSQKLCEDVNMADGPAQVVKLFYCYARVDKVLRDELDTHLTPLKRSGLITIWYDGELIPGARWEDEIHARLNTADIILLLISPAFMASDYCYSKEMTQAIARHDAGKACVIPILLRSVFWKGTPFSKLQMLPEDTKAVISWHDRDEAFLNVTEGIHRSIVEFTAKARSRGTAIVQSIVTPKEQKNDVTDNRTGRKKSPSPRSIQTSIPPYVDNLIDDSDIERQVYTVLDIGTAYAKAMIIEIHGDQAEVLGVGRYPQSYRHMSDGIIIDIPGVIENCNEALLRAEKAAGGIIAPSTIMGIANVQVKGSSTTVGRQRSNPTKPIIPEELDALIASAQQFLLSNTRERILAETGYQNTELRLMNTAINSIRIDGLTVNNPIGLRGNQFELTLFSAFAPLTQLGVLETVAQGLDLMLVTIVAEPYALARCLGTNDSGAIFVDIGAGTTNIALVRQGGIEEIWIFPQGGRTFTRRIATSKGISIRDAERFKVSYSKGEIKGSEREEFRAILAPECQTWMDIVALIIEELAKGEFLPPAIYVMGGGSRLIDICDQLENFP